MGQNGRGSDASHAQGWKSQAAVNEPWVKQYVQKKSRDQKIAKRLGVPVGIQDCIQHVQEQKQRRPVKDGVHILDADGEIVTGGPQRRKQKRGNGDTERPNEKREQHAIDYPMHGNQLCVFKSSCTQQGGHNRRESR